MQQVELALGKYKEINRSFPHITEAALYDTLRNYFVIPIDANHLYRNDKNQSTYIAIGSKNNVIIYRCPTTLGTGDYTLYWVGSNGIDEQGRGDDIFVSHGKIPKQLSHKLQISFKADTVKTDFSLVATGSDLTKDSVKFQIRSGNILLYTDWWQLGSYVTGRSDLSETERQETINMEFDRFFHPVHFIPADSLNSDARYASIMKGIGNSTFKNLTSRKSRIFTYFAGNNGVRALYWNSRDRKINVISVASR